MASWGHLGSAEVPRTLFFAEENACRHFATLKLSVHLLGSSSRLLGRSGAETKPRNGAKSDPKIAQKRVQIWITFWMSFWTTFATIPFLGSRSTLKVGPKVEPKLEPKVEVSPPSELRFQG